MKHDVLRSIVHNVADALADGVGLRIGMVFTHVFDEAGASSGGSIVVDFKAGVVVEGNASERLRFAVGLYRDFLGRLVSTAGGDESSLKRAQVEFWKDRLGNGFVVTVVDGAGKGTVSSYGSRGERIGRVRSLPTDSFQE